MNIGIYCYWICKSPKLASALKIQYGSHSSHCAVRSNVGCNNKIVASRPIAELYPWVEKETIVVILYYHHVIYGHWCHVCVSRWNISGDGLPIYCSTTVIWGRNQMCTGDEQFQHCLTSHCQSDKKTNRISAQLCLQQLVMGNSKGSIPFQLI